MNIYKSTFIVYICFPSFLNRPLDGGLYKNLMITLYQSYPSLLTSFGVVHNPAQRQSSEAEEIRNSFLDILSCI